MIELRRQLWTRIGMIMEDAVGVAVLVGHADASRLEDVLLELNIAIKRCNALIAAAEAL